MVKQTLVKSNLAKRGGALDEKRAGGAWRGGVGEAVAGKESGRQRREKMRGGAVLSVDPSHSRAAIGDGERDEQIIPDPIEECEFLKGHPAEFGV